MIAGSRELRPCFEKASHAEIGFGFSNPFPDSGRFRVYWVYWGWGVRVGAYRAYRGLCHHFRFSGLGYRVELIGLGLRVYRVLGLWDL